MTAIGIIGGLLFIFLLFSGIPIFAALTLFGCGIMLLTQGELGSLAEVVFSDLNQYLLVAIPLFAFMAYVMIRAKIVDDLYETAYVLTRHLPGGLSIATIAACTIFAAISGSSVATALTIGAVAIPQMIKYGYSPHMAYGLVAAGGTLGILIPPSGPMILFGVIADTSIGGLFMAGIIPGIVLAGVFVCWGMWSSRGRNIKISPRANNKEIILALKKSAWAFALPIFVLGGMYAGVFTATEAAAAGAWLAVVVGCFIYKTLRIKDIWDATIDACNISAMLFMILAGASVFGHALTKVRIPQAVVESLVAADIGAFGFIFLIMMIVFVMGMFLESISIILITTPIVLPALHHFDINTIWYGVLLVINLELAMITPPVGMNLFTVKAIANSSLSEVVKGSAPYVILMIIVLAMVLVWPNLALWLPDTMKGY